VKRRLRGKTKPLQIDKAFYPLYNGKIITLLEGFLFQKGHIMDVNEGQNNSEPGAGPMPNMQALPTQTNPEKITVNKKGTGWKIFWGIITGLSVLANIFLLMFLLAVIAFFTTKRRADYNEEVIQSGPRTSKIMVIRLEGVIDSLQAEDISEQVKNAQNDLNVKSLILRVTSPGGTVSGSDRIHNDISKFREESGKPVVAFMQGIAASGGYYTSVACDKIVAEPTTITGSIGVMFGHLVFKELLEEKLGIEVTVVKAGDRKDWPSPFEPMTEEQQQYIHERLIDPAYERFVSLVAQGRPMLTMAQVRQLADGSVYNAEQALEENLIDQVGYLDEAIDSAKELARLEKARVVEYQKPFSLGRWLASGTKTSLTINRNTLLELASPQLLYFWQP
jgi:protease-4